MLFMLPAGPNSNWLLEKSKRARQNVDRIHRRSGNSPWNRSIQDVGAEGRDASALADRRKNESLAIADHSSAGHSHARYSI